MGLGSWSLVRPWSLVLGPVTIAAALAATQLSAAQQTPNWEAVSVKPCTQFYPRGGGVKVTPGHMALNCQTVSAFIGWAYVQYAGGRPHPIYAVSEAGTAVEGGPSWVRSDRYTIEAVANGTPSDHMMQGPMLQTILEERFKVRVHFETREVPVYHLTVADSGPKLKPFKEGTCTQLAVTRDDFIPPKLPAGERYCGSFVSPGATWNLFAEGTSLDEFATLHLSGAPFVGRRVFDRTNLKGLYTIDLDFSMARSVGQNPAASDNGASIFTALREQLGLRLEPARGPGEFLVIDGVERPSEN